jgi:hypothetical protein
VAKRLVNVAVIPAAMLAAACVIVAAWGALADDPLEEGVAVGNKELVSFRQGYDFRVGLLTPAPIFGLRMRAPTEAEVAAEEEAWGRPKHWLRLPSTDFSLWWPFSASVVVLGVWVVMRRSRPRRGFPVTAVAFG